MTEGATGIFGGDQNHKKKDDASLIAQLYQQIGQLKAIYRRPKISKQAAGHKIYPYLLGGLKITQPHQVWAADITYIPMARGFLYLAAIIDWYSRVCALLAAVKHLGCRLLY